MASLRVPAAVILAAVLASFSLAVLASATPGPLAAPSPTAAPVEPHVFYGVTPIPPPMPKVPVVGKLHEFWGPLSPAEGDPGWNCLTQGNGSC